MSVMAAPAMKASGCPSDELAGVGGVGPDNGDLGVHEPEMEEHFLGCVAVGHVGWGDHDEQREPPRVHGDVPCAAIDLLHRPRPD